MMGGHRSSASSLDCAPSLAVSAREGYLLYRLWQLIGSPVSVFLPRFLASLFCWDNSCAGAASADGGRDSSWLPGVPAGPLHEQRGFDGRRGRLPKRLQLFGEGTGGFMRAAP